MTIPNCYALFNRFQQITKMYLHQTSTFSSKRLEEKHKPSAYLLGYICCRWTFVIHLHAAIKCRKLPSDNSEQPVTASCVLARW